LLDISYERPGEMFGLKLVTLFSAYTGIEGVLEHPHLGDGISDFDQLRRRIPACENQVHSGRFLIADEVGVLKQHGR
jgi:hypothetical protein